MNHSEIEKAENYVKYVSQITSILDDAKAAGFNIETLMKDALAKANI